MPNVERKPRTDESQTDVREVANVFSDLGDIVDFVGEMAERKVKKGRRGNARDLVRYLQRGVDGLVEVFKTGPDSRVTKFKSTFADGSDVEFERNLVGELSVIRLKGEVTQAVIFMDVIYDLGNFRLIQIDSEQDDVRRTFSLSRTKKNGRTFTDIEYHKVVKTNFHIAL